MSTGASARDAEVAATLPAPAADSLLVTEVYASVQGESTFAGLPFVLLRTARCNLRCTWCDSAFTFRGGTRRGVAELVAEVLGHGLRHVLVTGGEPLLQPAVLPLLAQLCDAGLTVLLETGGSLDVTPVDPRVHRIVDVKCPGSGEAQRNLWSNLAALGPRDELKFVVADRADYEWSRDVLAAHRPAERGVTVLFSPVWGDPALPGSIAEWLVADRLEARLQVQLHKLLWPADARRR